MFHNTMIIIILLLIGVIALLWRRVKTLTRKDQQREETLQAQSAVLKRAQQRQALAYAVQRLPDRALDEQLQKTGALRDD